MLQQIKEIKLSSSHVYYEIDGKTGEIDIYESGAGGHVVTLTIDEIHKLARLAKQHINNYKKGEA